MFRVRAAGSKPPGPSPPRCRHPSPSPPCWPLRTQELRLGMRTSVSLSSFTEKHEGLFSTERDSGRLSNAGRWCLRVSGLYDSRRPWRALRGLGDTDGVPFQPDWTSHLRRDGPRPHPGPSLGTSRSSPPQSARTPPPPPLSSPQLSGLSCLRLHPPGNAKLVSLILKPITSLGCLVASQL